MFLAEISAPPPADNLIYIVYIMIAGFCVTMAAVVTVVLKFGSWLRKGSLDALKSEDGRKIMIEHVTDSSAITEKIRREAGAQAEQAIQPLMNKFENLTKEVQGMREDLHSIAQGITEATQKFTETQHNLDKRLYMIEERHTDAA